MDRTVYITIAGKSYPMRNSLGASKKISERFGGFDKILDGMDGLSSEGKLEMFIGIAEILIAQGCAYKNLFEANMPIPEGAAAENGRYVPITAQELEIAVSMDDTEMLMDAITECFNAGQKKTIASAEKEPKNVEAM